MDRLWLQWRWSNDWSPVYAAVRTTGRFKAYMHAVGMIDYWRRNGWPDLCHPTTGDDFECN